MNAIISTLISALLTLFSLIQAPANPSEPVAPAARIFYTKPLVVTEISYADYTQELTLTTLYESGFEYHLSIEDGDFWYGDVLACVMFNNLTPDTIEDDIILVH